MRPEEQQEEEGRREDPANEKDNEKLLYFNEVRMAGRPEAEQASTRAGGGKRERATESANGKKGKQKPWVRNEMQKKTKKKKRETTCLLSS